MGTYGDRKNILSLKTENRQKTAIIVMKKQYTF